MREFESLNVWKEAKAVTLDIYEIFKDRRDYGFKDQIQRASVSIMNNIAEGSESGSDAKFINFLNIAKGSCGEVQVCFTFVVHWASALQKQKKS